VARLLHGSNELAGAGFRLQPAQPAGLDYSDDCTWFESVWKWFDRFDSGDWAGLVLQELNSVLQIFIMVLISHQMIRLLYIWKKLKIFAEL
jgi:hypothetical protein